MALSLLVWSIHFVLPPRNRCLVAEDVTTEADNQQLQSRATSQGGSVMRLPLIGRQKNLAHTTLNSLINRFGIKGITVFFLIFWVCLNLTALMTPALIAALPWAGKLEKSYSSNLIWEKEFLKQMPSQMSHQYKDWNCWITFLGNWLGSQ